MDPSAVEEERALARSVEKGALEEEEEGEGEEAAPHPTSSSGRLTWWPLGTPCAMELCRTCKPSL